MYQTVHLMKYIFPRQFSLHNVFTSKVDPKETVQKFKDYTLREEEIAFQERRLRAKMCHAHSIETRLPKRLRGHALKLVQQLQKRSQRCPFSILLQHYCPVSGNAPQAAGTSPIHGQKTSQLPKTTLHNRAVSSSQMPHLASENLQSQPVTNCATTHAQVSAFCRSVVCHLLPDHFWGVGHAGKQNKREIMKQVDQFICLRRFESLSLHAVLQKVKVSNQCLRINLLAKAQRSVPYHGLYLPTALNPRQATLT